MGKCLGQARFYVLSARGGGGAGGTRDPNAADGSAHPTKWHGKHTADMAQPKCVWGGKEKQASPWQRMHTCAQPCMHTMHFGMGAKQLPQPSKL